MSDSMKHNSMLAESYQYAPLPNPRCTRMIVLEPACERAAQIRFRLDDLYVDSPHPYEALSYTWGGQRPDRPVLCNGRELLITANAEAAMRRLRRTFRARCLGIDSICIDQASPDEKNVQVARHCRNCFSDGSLVGRSRSSIYDLIK
jgi:Heterokaryon incompatibility protein (HET)